MSRGNLGMALLCIVVIQLLVGYDENYELGRVFSYNAMDGRYEVARYHSIESESVYARSSIKKLYKEDLSETNSVEFARDSLCVVADYDTATGGPDLHRNIYHLVDVITEDGHRRMDTDEVAELATRVVERRAVDPDGPTASLS